MLRMTFCFRTCVPGYSRYRPCSIRQRGLCLPPPASLTKHLIDRISCHLSLLVSGVGGGEERPTKAKAAKASARNLKRSAQKQSTRAQVHQQLPTNIRDMQNPGFVFKSGLPEERSGAHATCNALGHTHMLPDLQQHDVFQ